MALRREADGPPSSSAWVRNHAAGLICAGLGLISTTIAAIICFGGDTVTRIPDARVTTPFLVAALVAALIALIRREGAYALPVAGVALAGAAMVMGWAVVVGVIAVATAVIILMMQELM